MKVNATSLNWGFCNKQCGYSDPLDNLLQEARLRLVPKSECMKLAKELKVSKSNEICAGNKVFRRKDAYRAFFKAKKKKLGLCTHPYERSF